MTERHQLTIDRTQRRVVCAAVMTGDTIVCAPRHYDQTMHEQISRMDSRYKEKFIEGCAIQGFVDQWGKYMSREEAFEVATAAGQIIKKTGNPDSKELFSEDIY